MGKLITIVAMAEYAAESRGDWRNVRSAREFSVRRRTAFGKRRRPWAVSARRHGGVRTSVAVAFVAAVSVGVGQLSAGTAVAEPPSSADKIATLINQIADTNQNLVNLDGDVAVKREAVNRALVDLQNAREGQRLAAIAVRGAQEALRGAAGAITLAETDFNGFIRSLYTQGNSQGSMASYLSGDPGAVLDRASVIDQLSKSQQETITRLQQARNEEANRAATAEATEQQGTVRPTLRARSPKR
jgi:hypothetical protein